MTVWAWVAKVYPACLATNVQATPLGAQNALVPFTENRCSLSFELVLSGFFRGHFYCYYCARRIGWGGRFRADPEVVLRPLGPAFGPLSELCWTR